MRRRPDVVLVVMPFAAVQWPALGVSLLAAALARRSVRARVEYLNLEYAQVLGLEAYDWIARGSPETALLGEWAFAQAAFGDATDSLPGLVEERYPWLGPNLAHVAEARRAAGRFVEAAADRLARLDASIYGFTTTFQQNTASVALARALKERRPGSLVVFGGGNCAGEMGAAIARLVPWVDHVFSGEADGTFAAFAVAALAGRRDHPRVIRQPLYAGPLDSLPTPAFDEYFDHPALERLGVAPSLMIETSRGCWWGEKHHCTFCGLNAEAMTYRRKSAERVMAEIDELVARHGVTSVRTVDNILDMRFFRSLLPSLRAVTPRLSLFFELKSNLTRAQVEALREAGVREAQVGIESLSTPVLRLMRKGATALQNVQALKWCLEAGIDASWNILLGFPGEDQRDYARMAATLDLLPHLRPPDSCGPFRLDRFSPYFNDPAGFGLTHVRPAEAYAHVYPFPAPELSRLAYYFDYDGPSRWERYAAGLMESVYRWMRGWRGGERPVLEVTDGGEGRLLVRDTRSPAAPSLRVLEGLPARVLRCCDAAHTPARIREALEWPSLADVQAAVDGLARDRLVMVEDGYALALTTGGGAARPT